jgi:hypothetical protein
MEQTKITHYDDADVASIGALLSVVAAAFVVLGVIIYFFGDDQSSTATIEYNQPPMTERMLRNRSAMSDDIGLPSQFDRL